jgi:hypothetical protein
MTDITCLSVEYHDDMYPEFAPQPIEVACSKPAEVLWVVTEDGYTEAMVLCESHAYHRFSHAVESRQPFRMRLLGDTDRRDFRAGESYANFTDIGEHQAQVAHYQGWLEAGFCTPDHSSEVFDIGWEWTMIRRVQTILVAVNERMEMEEQAQYERYSMGEDRFNEESQ